MTPEMLNALAAEVTQHDGVYVHGYMFVAATLITETEEGPAGTEQVVEYALMGVALDASGTTLFDMSNGPLPILHRGWVLRSEIPRVIAALQEAYDG